MARAIKDDVLLQIPKTAFPLEHEPDAFDPLLELIGDASFVLLGEASHGTHEFYRTRADITRRLMREKGFHALRSPALNMSRTVVTPGSSVVPSPSIPSLPSAPSRSWLGHRGVLKTRTLLSRDRQGAVLDRR